MKNILYLYYNDQTVFHGIKPILSAYSLDCRELLLLNSENYEPLADLIIMEAPKNMGELEYFSHILELKCDIPYILICKTVGNNDEFYSPMMLTKFQISEYMIPLLTDRISNFFSSKKQNDLSLFELPDIMQMISAEQKTISLKVVSENRVGIIAFRNGVPYYGKVIQKKEIIEGHLAVFKMLMWKNPNYKLIITQDDLPKNIEMGLTFLLMEAMKYQDEYLEEEKLKSFDNISDDYEYLLNPFSEIPDFMGAGVFSEVGDLLGIITTNEDLNKERIGLMLCNVLIHAKKITEKIGFGRTEFILIESEAGSFLAINSIKTKINLILFLGKNSNIPKAKMLLQKTVIHLENGY